MIPLVYKPGVNAKVERVLNAISAKLTTPGAAGDGQGARHRPRSYQQVAAGFAARLASAAVGIGLPGPAGRYPGHYSDRQPG